MLSFSQIVNEKDQISLFILVIFTCSLIVIKGVVEDLELPHDDSHGGVILKVRVAIQMPHGAWKGLR